MSELLKNLAMFGASGSLLGKSNFADTPAATQSSSDSMSLGLLIFILVVVVIFFILSLVATYRLTNSGLHTFLCFLFGILYILISYIYYGLAGYRFTKRF
jgi:uncharacterized membrane protein